MFMKLQLSNFRTWFKKDSLPLIYYIKYKLYNKYEKKMLGVLKSNVLGILKINFD